VFGENKQIQRFKHTHDKKRQTQTKNHSVWGKRHDKKDKHKQIQKQKKTTKHKELNT